MALVSLLSLIIGFLSYFCNLRYVTLVIIFSLSTSYFGLANNFSYVGPIPIHNSDMAIMLILSLLPFRVRSIPDETKSILKGILLFMSFLAISVVYDYLERGTSLLQIFKTIRHTLYLIFFFLITSFSFTDYQKFLKVLLFFTVLHSFFYLSQYLFGFSYSNNFIYNEMGGSRYSGIPTYITFFFAVLIVGSSEISKNLFTRNFFIILFSITVIFYQSRGAIISLVTIYLLNYYFNHKNRLINLFLVSIFTTLVYTLVFNFFPIISERFLIAFNEIENLSVMDHDNLVAFYHEGSLIFRWGMTYERFLHTTEEISRMFFGSGFIPDMDLKEQVFILGTHSPLIPLGFEQYNSKDIIFPNLLSRYGFLGTLIFLGLIGKILKFSIQKKNDLWGKVLLLYIISMISISLVNESFYNCQNFLIVFVLLGTLLQKHKINSLTALSRKYEN